MKKIIALLIFAAASVAAYAQSNSARVYCELVTVKTAAVQKDSKVKVDFGLSTDSSGKLVADKSKDSRTFNSIVDAMNFMSSIGWVLEETYVVPVEASTAEIHYVLSRYLSAGESIDDGLYSKKQSKKK